MRSRKTRLRADASTCAGEPVAREAPDLLVVVLEESEEEGLAELGEEPVLEAREVPPPERARRAAADERPEREAGLLRSEARVDVAGRERVLVEAAAVVD